MRKLLVMTGMTVLCVYGIAQEEKMKALYNGLSVEELCRVLEEKFDDPGTVDLVMKKLYYMARIDRMTPGHPQALYWARRVAKEKPEEAGAVRGYLDWKGDAQDLELMPSNRGKMLQERVAGTNLLHEGTMSSLYFPDYIPSVTNTGSQGVYAEAILRQYWKNMEAMTNSYGYACKYIFQIPDELLTLAVWFDKKGNPVCNVDMAKYGLTMPVIEPNPTSPDFNWPDYYTITYPPLAEPPSLPRRLLPYALIIPAAMPGAQGFRLADMPGAQGFRPA